MELQTTTIKFVITTNADHGQETAEVNVPLVATMKALSDIRAKAGPDDFKALSLFIEHIAAKHDGTALDLDQADALWNAVEVEYLKKKRGHVEALRTIAESQSSTT